MSWRLSLLLLSLGLAAGAGEPAPSPVDSVVAAAGPSPAQLRLGEALYGKHICSVCHSTDGSRRAAPSFKGLFGTRKKLRDGSEVVVDASYIRESILTPGAKVAQGFQPVMPPYQGRLTPEEIEALISYIQSLR